MKFARPDEIKNNRFSFIQDFPHKASNRTKMIKFAFLILFISVLIDLNSAKIQKELSSDKNKLKGKTIPKYARKPIGKRMKNFFKKRSSLKFPGKIRKSVKVKNKDEKKRIKTKRLIVQKSRKKI